MPRFKGPGIAPAIVATTADPPSRRRISVEQPLSDALVRALFDAGVRHAFGLTGGAIAPLARALHEGPIDLVHCRHETGAAFAALESYFASGRPAVVFTTTGPGVANALTGMAAARWEGGKVLLLSAATAPANRGRWAFQETHAIEARGLHPSGSVFDDAWLLDDPAAFPGVAARILRGFRRPGPYVAHLQMSIGAQTARMHAPPPPAALDWGPSGCAPATVERVLGQLAGTSFVLWVGAGARTSAEQVRRFADATRAPVMSTPRGKGIFPEGHPAYLGVTGFGGHAAVDEYLAAHRPDSLVVLGSRLGEMTSLWDAKMLPSRHLIHVDIDADAFGGAFPDAPATNVLADAGEFLDALLKRSRGGLRSKAAPRAADPFRPPPAGRRAGAVRPEVVMAAIQRVLDEREDTIVLSEAGNSFAWTTHCLRFSRPVYRTSMGFGSMGHAATGVLGAALGSSGKALAVVGDGSMLMNSEVSTAVEYGIPAVWVVLNDGRYGMIEEGMQSVGYAPFATNIPRANFARIAAALGARGANVRGEAELPAALAEAMAAKGPFVLDVDLATNVAAPARKRNASLLDQGISTGPGAAR
jgi:acetolactate synthase-1/2/3 large subunit